MPRAAAPAMLAARGCSGSIYRDHDVIAAHRLRELSCLDGFTRFEAAPTSADGELEEVASREFAD